MKGMRAVLIAFFMFCLSWVSAQVVPCSIDPQYTVPGFYPISDSIPCFVGDNEWNNTTIHFVNFDSINYNGLLARVDYVTIDSILNLPCGIKWYTSADNAPIRNRFEQSEKGCIRFWGRNDDASGQYRLKIKLKVKLYLLPMELPYEAEDFGFRFDVRLKDNAAATVCPDIDTTAGATLSTAFCASINREWIVADCWDEPCDIGISQIRSISNFIFHPNPTNYTAAVSFTADKAAIYTARIVNMYGAEVSREVLKVQPGEHRQLLEVSHLPPGVYIYTLNEGTKVLAHRFVVE